MSLYNIQQNHLSLLARIEDVEGELDDNLEAELGFTLEAFQETAVSVGFMTKHVDDGVAMIDKEIERLQAMRSMGEKRQDWLKRQLSGAMQQFGIEKIDTPTLKISFRKSEAVEITDEKLLPESVKEAVPATMKISKTKIKEFIKAGQDVPGALLVTRSNLQIK